MSAVKLMIMEGDPLSAVNITLVIIIIGHVAN